MAANRAVRYAGMALCELVDSILVLLLRANGKLRRNDGHGSGEGVGVGRPEAPLSSRQAAPSPDDSPTCGVIAAMGSVRPWADSVCGQPVVPGTDRCADHSDGSEGA